MTNAGTSPGMIQSNNAIQLLESLELFWKRHGPNIRITERIECKLGAVISLIIINKKQAQNADNSEKKQEMESVGQGPNEIIWPWI